MKEKGLFCDEDDERGSPFCGGRLKVQVAAHARLCKRYGSALLRFPFWDIKNYYFGSPVETISRWMVITCVSRGRWMCSGRRGYTLRLFEAITDWHHAKHAGSLLGGEYVQKIHTIMNGRTKKCIISPMRSDPCAVRSARDFPSLYINVRCRPSKTQVKNMNFTSVWDTRHPSLTFFCHHEPKPRLGDRRGDNC